MARKNLEELAKQNEELEKFSESDLKTLIDDYGSCNDELKLLKKSVESKNTQVKAYMHNLLKPDSEGVRKSEGENYIAVLSIRDNSVMNEERLIKWLKKNGFAKGIVKKKDYVDAQALEAAIYKGTISDEMVADMESCKDPKPTEVLNIKKKKGAK